MFLQVEKDCGLSYAAQIYAQIRSMILRGELREGEKLTSTRELSSQLRVSRNTVLIAYDMLSAEGFLRGESGSGVFVREGVKFVNSPEQISDYSMSAFAHAPLDGDTIAFHSGTPALELFPRAKWNKIASQALMEAPVSSLGYDDPQGRIELRRTLAAYLKKTRGIDCQSDQILITSGAKQGITLLAKSLLNGDEEVWLEDPSNLNVRKIFSYHTEKITPIAVDRQGIRPELFSTDRSPAFIFVSPSHQFPMGGILSVQRRLQLVHFAQKVGCFIVEDDYDSEFRYNSLPIHALHEFAPDRVIYIGTFSKILFPSLRLGYLVLPPALIERFREWKRLSDHHSNSLCQLALMRFIESGDLQRHILRMKRLYARRRDTLLVLLEAHFGGNVRVFGAEAGMHVVCEFFGVDFSADCLAKLKCAGVDVIPVEEHSLEKGKHRSEIILGYAHLNTPQMEQGIIRLKQVLSSLDA